MKNKHKIYPHQQAVIDALTAPLEIGQKISIGGIVLKFKWREHREGEMPGQHGLVLCLLKENKYDPFVVWTFVKESTTEVISCMHGDYCHTLDEALVRFRLRLRTVGL